MKKELGFVFLRLPLTAPGDQKSIGYNEVVL